MDRSAVGNDVLVARKFRAAYKLQDLISNPAFLLGDNAKTPAITTKMVLDEIDKNSEDFPDAVTWEYKDHIGKFRYKDSWFYGSGEISATIDEFSVSADHNLPVPDTVLYQAGYAALSKAIQSLQSPNLTPDLFGDYLRIIDVKVNASGVSFKIEWKLGPYKDSIKVEVPTGLTGNWKTVMSYDLGIVDVKIKAKLPNPNRLCAKVEVKVPTLGWKEVKSDCTNF